MQVFCANFPILTESWTCPDCDKINHSSIDSATLNGLLQDIENIKTKQVEFKVYMDVIDSLKTKHDEFTDAICDLSTKLSLVVKLNDKVNELDQNIIKIQASNDELIKENSILTQRLSNIEQHAYRCNIELTNVTESQNENIFNILSAVGNYLNFKIDKNEIEHIHRTYIKSSIKPIVVEFHSKSTRDNFLLAYRTCKTQLTPEILGIDNKSDRMIFINEHLPHGRINYLQTQSLN